MSFVISTKLFAETKSIFIPSNKLRDSIECSEENLKTVEIRDREQVFQAVVSEFAQTPIVNSRAVCELFLKSWEKKLKKKPVTNIQFDLNLDPNRKEEEVYYLHSPEFVSACKSEGFCVSSAFDYLNLNKSLAECQPKQSLFEIFNRMLPRFRRPSYTEVSSVDIQIFPFVPLVNKLDEYLKNSKDKVFASTMTLGEGTATKLYMKYKNSKSKLIFALDAGLALSGGQGHMLGTYFSKHPSIFAVPVTSGHEFNTLFHWKLIADPNQNNSLISSMNLSTPLKTPYIDLVYEFKDQPEVRNELLFRFSEVLRNQCERMSEFKCLAKITEKDQVEFEKVEDILTRSCQQFLTSEEKINSSSKYFMEPQTDDVEDLILKLIDEAKEEVIVLTHKFSLPSIYSKLEESSSKGVSVYVVSSNKPRITSKTASWFYYPEKLKERFIPEPHMKLVLVDRKLLIFGTGNLTYNAFNNAKEMFAVTRDKTAISKILMIFSSFIHGYDSTKSADFNQASDQHWIVGDIRRSDTINRLKTLKDTEAVNNDWMVNYRKIKPSANSKLKNCNLDHLLLIPEFDYTECMKNESS